MENSSAHLRRAKLRRVLPHLESVNLQVLGRAVAEVLELGADEVLVTDVRDQGVTLDILRRTVIAEQIVGADETNQE